MKLSAFKQSYLNRRSNSFRGLDSPVDGSIKSPASIFWFVLHGFCCLISLVLGFRFSRLVFFFIFSTSSSNLYTIPFRSELGGALERFKTPENLELPVNGTSSVSTSSRVVVGRHGIRIRKWPHPNLVEVIKAHKIIDVVQREQRRQFGVKNPRKVIAVTPTYVRTFQTLHMTGLMHSLMLVPYDVVWIVVEAGEATDETASVLAKSGLRTIHVGFGQEMPNSWEDRHQLEARMRLFGLRIIREQKLDGIVIFADDSNMHSMELFEEIQNVQWFGALSVGILAHTGDVDETSVSMTQEKEDENNPSVPVQGPACNASNSLIGWHTFNSLAYQGKSAIYVDDHATVLPRKLEWSGFVLNSRLLWMEEDKPEWINDLDTINGVDVDMESPLFFLKDRAMIEPLGSCGRQVLIWWHRVEARYDSKFPSRWTIDPPLEVNVPSKRTPWPDSPPELPSNEHVSTTNQQHAVKDSTKTRFRKRRSKTWQDTRTKDMEVSSKHSE